VGSSELDAVLGDTERILLDTSTLIAYHNPHEQVYALARHMMGRVASDEDPLRGYYSTISAAELLVRPMRTHAADVTHMQAFLTSYPHLHVLPADLTVAAQAANVRAITRLNLADAFIIASGLVYGCEAIVSNDEQWRRHLAPLFSQFHWIYLGAYL
jgi:predicted nucleic acid-binding protein